MTTPTTTVFDLPARLAAKADPALIAADEAHFAAIAESLRAEIADTTTRLAAAQQLPGRAGPAALERDTEVRRLSARLTVLRRYRMDVCLGHIVRDGDDEPVYIGRIGLTGRDGRALLADWRSPVSEPFFAATHANPLGLVRRRRYRWRGGRIDDYWDELFRFDGDVRAALDDDSALIASLATARSPRMRDVLATIQADQDAIIRAGSQGALVVDGGPGTGKTVVALHRAAYLLYADPRVDRSRGGVLFVGPHQPYLGYVSDVLPALGEQGVQLCTLADMVPGGAGMPVEPDPRVAALKSDPRFERVIDRATRYYEQPPTDDTVIETPWGDIVIDAGDWAEAFAAPDATSSHNEARAEVLEALIDILVDRHSDEDAPPHVVRRALLRHGELTAAVRRAWPMLEPANVVADLWTSAAYLRLCAPWLDDTAVGLLSRGDAHAWTSADLPLLDAARLRIGDLESARRMQHHAAAIDRERERVEILVDELLTTDDDGEGLVTMLRNEDLQETLIDQYALPRPTPDELAGPFAHVVVDEAQELTDAQWQMLLRRCPSRSFTIVGDRAQARHGFQETWGERLERVGMRRTQISSLRTNYRTPQEVMDAAEPVIRAALPDANVPTSVRSTGEPVTHAAASERDAILDEWLTTHAEGTACVIGAPEFAERPRVSSLTPELAKGLEFDLVLLVNPDRFGDGVSGAVDRYVAMTRATQRLVVLTG